DTGKPSSTAGSVSGEFKRSRPIPASTLQDTFETGEPSGFSPDSWIANAVKDGEKLVVLAIIDDAVAFANAGFRDSHNKSRIEFLWSQSAQSDGRGTVPMGREFDRDWIDASIARHDGREDDIYRDPELGRNPDPLEDYDPYRGYSHGTHVLDTAAGFGLADRVQDRDALDRIRMIAVELPPDVLRDTSGYGKDAFILSALHYIFARTNALKQAYGTEEVHLLVNLSLGMTGGPHDGSHPLEQAIDEMVEARRATEGGLTVVALPSGNSHAGRLHAVAEAEGKPSTLEADLGWRVQPNDRTANSVEVYFEFRGDLPETVSEFLQQADIELKDPAGAVPASFGPGTSSADGPILIQDLDEGNPAAGQVAIEFYQETVWRLVIILPPTEVSYSEATTALSGLWTIGLRSAQRQTGLNKARAYIHRDIDVQDVRNGARQSFFDDPDYRDTDCEGRRFGLVGIEDDGIIRRNGSVNGWATSSVTITPKARVVVGGYVDFAWDETADQQQIIDDLKPAWYSCGPDGSHRLAIDFGAPSETSSITSGIRAAGTRSGSVSWLSGTSAAVPAFLRELALDLLQDPDPGGPVGTLLVEIGEKRLGRVYAKASRFQDGQRDYSLGRHLVAEAN
ncbi:MAG: hypothetical protein ACR2PF_16370, partial [Rhizobiaceae bacterium]